MTTPNQSFTFNAYQSNLAGPLLAGLTTVAIDFIPAGLGVPAYLVIDPDVPASREYIKVLAYTGNTIDSMERNLEGSAGDVDHLVGAVIRAVYTMQALDDTFLDIEANTTAQTAHINDPGDPHAAADYQKTSEADVRYLRLDGVLPMAAAIDMANFPINQLATPTVDDDAATKKYVDDADGLYLLLSGASVMGGALNMGNNVIQNLDPPTAPLMAANRDYVNDQDALRLALTGGTLTGALQFLFGGLDITLAQRSGRLSFQGPGGLPLILELDAGTSQSLFADGTSALPSISFSALASQGFYRHTGAVGRIAYSASGVDRIWIDTSGTWLRTAAPTGSAANIFADGSNLLLKSTSARKYKTNIEPASELADLVLEPVTFHRDDDDKDFIGFIADDMPDVRAITYDDDDEVEDYDVRAVVAILAAKVNRLELLL